MRGNLLLTVTALSMAAASALADHDNGCVLGGADPSTYNTVAVGGRTFYVEERSVPPPFHADPPVPGSGFFFGDGTWLWEEDNGVPGLQRGGCELFLFSVDGEPEPSVQEVCQCWLHPFCWDPGWDEHCGHGPDHYIL